jgi:hypothetical protein
MKRLKPTLARCFALIAFLVGCIPALTPSAPASAAPPTTAVFPPGVWKGSGVMTGAISIDGATAFSEGPWIFRFTVEIAPDGSVVDGSIEGSGTVSAVVPGGEGTFEISLTSTLGGSSAWIETNGNLHMSGSVIAQDMNVPVELDFEAMGGFSATSSSCTVVTGDYAAEARDAQMDAGLATSVTGPFTAVRVAAAGDNLAPGFEEQYVALVQQADALVAMVTPPAADVVALVAQSEDFYQNVASSTACPGGPTNLEPGKQPYTYFVRKVGELLLKALANPAAYSVADIDAMATAALRIGVIGGAAPDAALGQQVDQVLFDALATKLGEAIESQNAADCGMIHITAGMLGFDDMLADAQTCAKGA